MTFMAGGDNARRAVTQHLFRELDRDAAARADGGVADGRADGGVAVEAQGRGLHEDAQDELELEHGEGSPDAAARAAAEREELRGCVAAGEEAVGIETLGLGVEVGPAMDADDR